MRVQTATPRDPPRPLVAASAAPRPALTVTSATTRSVGGCASSAAKRIPARSASPANTSTRVAVGPASRAASPSREPIAGRCRTETAETALTPPAFLECRRR